MRRFIASLMAAVGVAAPALALDIDPEWSIARVWDEQTLFAIRKSTPRPPIHARNLYHVSAAMYDAWATYDEVAHGRFFFEKHTAEDVQAAREEAMSYAAYRILKERYVPGNGPNIAVIQADFDATFLALGYDKNNTNAVGDSPSAIGNRIANTIIAAGLADMSNEQNNYAPNNGYTVINPVLPFKIPGTTLNDPSHWQPLAFDFLILQNGEIVGASVQSVICPHWEWVTPFALNDVDKNPNTGLFFDAGPMPYPFGSQTMKDDAVDLIWKSSKMDPALPETIDISPGVYHNSPLGSYDMKGWGLNPVTGEAYPSNVIKLADYVRSLAEYWADGPTSETPPGHWHVLANEVSDTPDFPLEIGGEGDPVDRLEWDVKMYLAMGGANHDAAVVAWGMKGYYDTIRPISFIRHLGDLGQSSDPEGPDYDPNGLPLVPDLIEIVQPEDVAPGGRLQDFPHLVYEPISGEPVGVEDFVGKPMIKSWLGGFYGGVTGVSTQGPLPGHVYRDNGGWHIGGFALGANDSPGAVNPGHRRPRTIQISEIRLDQQGNDPDQYAELVGPPNASLKGLTYVVVGDEVQTGVPDSKGRIQTAIDLSGYTLDRNGVFVIGKSTLSLAKPNLTAAFQFRQIANCTHFLVSGFFGYEGEDLDLDGVVDNQLDFEPWSSVVDSVALRRTTDNFDIYSANVVGPDSSKNQTYGVGWMPATYWLPYQSSNFVTPPFPGFTSGHSTYSRAAAEVMTGYTGSPYFPGGLGEFTLPAGWSNFEVAPSAPVTMQWASYYDAADEAGVSRLWGGIHPRSDDLPARVSGSGVGKRAIIRAKALYRGLWQAPDINADGQVDGADLGLLLANWGGSGTGDLNGDGIVDGADLGLLLADWG